MYIDSDTFQTLHMAPELDIEVSPTDITMANRIILGDRPFQPQQLVNGDDIVQAVFSAARWKFSSLNCFWPEPWLSPATY